MKPIQSISFAEKINLIKAGLLEESIAVKLFDYWETIISEYTDTASYPYINYCILLLLIRANLLYFHVHDPKTKKIIHEFGLKEILPFSTEYLFEVKKIPDLIEYQGQKIGTWYRQYSRSSFHYNIFAFFPHNYDISSKIMQLKNLLIYYHSTFQRQRASTVQNLFQKTNAKIVNNLNQLLQTNQTIDIVHLKIESLEIYLEVGSKVLIENIENLIMETIQKNYVMYALSPSEYVIVIVNEERHVSEQFFKKVTFQHNGLPLQHNVKFINIEKKISCSSELWK